MDKQWFSLLAVELGKIPESEPFTIDDLKRAYALINLTLPQRYILAQINKMSENEALTVFCSPDKQHDVECVAAARKAPVNVVTSSYIPDVGTMYIAVTPTPIINISPMPMPNSAATGGIRRSPALRQFMRKYTGREE